MIKQAIFALTICLVSISFVDIATAEIRTFAGVCPICIENRLKSEVKVEANADCAPVAGCREDEYWDDAGEYYPSRSCYDCTKKFYYRCSQGHTFETVTDERGKSKK